LAYISGGHLEKQELLMTAGNQKRKRIKEAEKMQKTVSRRDSLLLGPCGSVNFLRDLKVLISSRGGAVKGYGAVGTLSNSLHKKGDYMALIIFPLNGGG